MTFRTHGVWPGDQFNGVLFSNVMHVSGDEPFPKTARDAQRGWDFGGPQHVLAEVGQSLPTNI